MAKKFADLTAQVKTEKRFSRRLDYPTAAAATRSPPLDAAAAAAERLSPVVATSPRSSPLQQSSASSSPSSVSRVTVGAPPQVVVEAAAQQQMRSQFHVHHEHLVRRSADLIMYFSENFSTSW